MIDALIIYGLAFYGAILLIWQLLHRLSHRVDGCHAQVIVVVEHAHLWVEWFIRTLSLQCFALGRNASEVVLIDLDGMGETAQIIERMQSSFPFITYVPSSRNRRWSDILSILETAKQTQALLLEVHTKDEIQQAVQMISRVVK
ncbi:hypothetical protein [Ferroacidibacillus organovorans]|uniref:Uncharacterized protein n=1 Tax=Ferroacidibacillus organovorans TaxID=1765683 RepID=A0A162UF44_9BACL|nr:hypothetical protein [Ferroacidibacillus organovorans]KYP81707.1 hypothetical protein AYJ22_06200 [Ferroacidibacillus organovorans]OAG94244.1 hypothetical protein AYW79_06410 [Ferroacidibacillus organovorans]OPG16921.1 hypothetical protein B2M26_04155 [Ferroacidibacillus organovorans]